MNKGRRKDHLWRFVKYNGDNAIYAICSCGFRYPCWKNKEGYVLSTEPNPEKLYNYCPICGSRKTKYDTEVKKIDAFPWEGITND